MVYRRGTVLKSLAIWQIYLIVISVISFTFLIYESSEVSAQIRTQDDSPIESESGFGSETRPVEAGAPPKQGFGVKAAAGISPVAPVSFGIPKGTEIGGYVTKGTESFTASKVPEGWQVFKDGKPFGDSLTDKGFESFSTEIANAGGKKFTEFQGPLGTSGWFGHIVSGLSWALLVVGAIQMVGGLAGWDDSLTNSLSIAVGGGIMATSLLQSIGPSGAGWYGGQSFLATDYGWFTGAGWTGVIATVVIFAAMYKKESTKIVNFQCLPYEAPIGGKECEKCNGDTFRPCSEYRCKALGQSCELVNVGSSDEKCVWVNPNDALSPTITPWTTPLTENHRYTSHAVRPASLGTKIVLNGAVNGCIKAFTPLTFGITTNEPAQCKIDLEHKKTLDEMQFFFGNTNLYLYNHTQQFSLPSPDSLNAELPELENDGKYDFFVRCRDKNGNENVDEFAVQFCVDPSPDTTAPVIVDTSIPSDSFVKFGVGNVPLQVYVNEPATCKWSSQDKSYDVMENSMTCATSLTQVNARSLYSCNTNFTGIIDRKINNFFVRCKDQPSKSEEDRNVNVVSYKYNLIGSQPLNIISVSPDGTVTGNTNTVPVNLKVVTDDGASEGIAICAFSPTGLPNSFIPMFETRAVEHTQRLDLTTGNYNYKIRCSDFGGNSAEAEISFSVFVDINAPLVTRAYRDSSNNALKIVTNEDASCTYSLNSCNFNFDEGIKLLYISTSNKKSHYAKWEPNLVYYIKCRDVFDNELGPNTCSFVASAVNLK